MSEHFVSVRDPVSDAGWRRVPVPEATAHVLKGRGYSFTVLVHQTRILEFCPDARVVEGPDWVLSDAESGFGYQHKFRAPTREAAVANLPKLHRYLRAKHRYVSGLIARAKEMIGNG